MENNEYQIVIQVLNEMRRVALFMGPEPWEEFGKLIEKYEHPKDLTDDDRRLTVNILNDGISRLKTQNIDDDLDMQKVMFLMNLCRFQLEIELKKNEKD